MNTKDYTPADRLIMGLDQALRTLFGRPQVTERRDPADDFAEAELSDERSK